MLAFTQTTISEFLTGVPILSIESSPTKAAENSDGSGHDDSQIQSGAQVKPAWQNDLAEQPPQYGPVGRSGNDDPSTPTLMVDNSDSGAFPVLLLKPTSAQSDGRICLEYLLLLWGFT